jgi:hypothetical protein
MEYGSDWRIIQRSKEEIQWLCATAGIKSSNVGISREATGLTFPVRVVRSD